ncbi:MAG: hypothetical protein A2847_00735 [Candidatus Sungbacteria bacterium RIFCSPHIGHO2_01_FULL_50_25]|uniref:Uncharacterized protein n=1 Tax=Candidatus Sungbacteria bacterium RIFCSPHIGHO2_01_FULL_50_25 TaxID=1802265 RepID=A0A1G2KCM8_9BACT|nr:MAG: hypothetical protein A2847_00735 [Candidatus Sungbacteria bacterium RIFCSPHIGHO2_01_FULL_50_25]
MEHLWNDDHKESPSKSKEWQLVVSSAIVASALVISSVVYSFGARIGAERIAKSPPAAPASDLAEKVLPARGVLLPVSFGELGIEMARAGVVDADAFRALYRGRGGLGEEEDIFERARDSAVVMTQENSGMWLNLFWALGLGNKNRILESGPMADARYGGTENFASTAGWTLAEGSAMDHYSRHQFMVLTLQEQEKVERVSKNIFRPCCGNSTYFPDCNHGMAMLGLLELMASQGVSEEEMYRAALKVNSYWFPDTYLTIAQYLSAKGVDWQDTDPKEILGAGFSSISGYRRVLESVDEKRQSQGSGCGIEAAPQPQNQQESGSGCGI